jgi:pimeloyl-ACP methyl ester carboxylesterase
MDRGQGEYGLSDGRWLEIDWAPSIERIEIESDLGRSEVEFVSVGEGPAIVLIHGLAGSWRNWLENIPRLADRHRVVALDLPGFGASPMPPEEITMPGYGSVVTALVRELKLPPDTVLVGHSMGGVVTTEAMLGSPSSFAGACLVAAAGPGATRTPEAAEEFASRLVSLYQDRPAIDPARSLSRRRLKTAQLAPFIAHPGEIGTEILWELLNWGARPPGLAQAALALGRLDGREALSEIGQPVLLIWGTRDLLVPLRIAYAYRRRLPDSELVVFQDTGHMIQMERPGRLNREIEEFVRGVTGGGADATQALLEPPDGR